MSCWICQAKQTDSKQNVKYRKGERKETQEVEYTKAQFLKSDTKISITVWECPVSYELKDLGGTACTFTL